MHARRGYSSTSSTSSSESSTTSKSPITRRREGVEEEEGSKILTSLGVPADIVKKRDEEKRNIEKTRGSGEVLT